MGNSEVGHLTIGAGRVLDQDFQRVNRAIADGTFFENEALVSAFRRARERDGDVHLLGLVSYGGVHSHIDHLRALLELAQREGMTQRTWIHAFTDGRDVSPTSAVRDLAELPDARIATISGRYYAMDRDNRWERTQLALDAIFHRGTPMVATTDTAITCVQKSYAAGVTDEFIVPLWREGRPPLDPTKDAAIFFNFRPDRGTAAEREAGRAQNRPDHDDEVQGGLRLSDRLPGADRRHGSCRGTRAARRPAAPHGGDGEVRARHVLLQRRPRGRVPGRDAGARSLAAGRAEL